MIDVHAHLTRNDVYSMTEGLIEEAKKGGIRAIINATLRSNEVERALKLTRRYRGFVYTCLGYDYTGFDVKEVESIMKIISQNKGDVICVGEVGLDFVKIRDEVLRRISMHIFTKWVEFARDNDLPIVIHSRGAERVVIEALRRYGPVKCILHAFGGSKDEVEKLLALGCYFSIPPTIVRSGQKRDLARLVPLERLLAESDTPELGPKEDEPSRPIHVRIVVEELSRVLNRDIDEVAKALTENAIRLFGL